MTKDVWMQLKSMRCEELIRALKKDGFVREFSRGATQTYYHPEDRRRITIHYHPGKTYGEKFLKRLLESLSWTDEDLKRLKLIKKK